MTPEALDERYMRRALLHAARGQGRTTPNPMVGAVVVDAGGIVVGHGWHDRAGMPHAEVHAIEAAGARARGATMYVTLEPCCHVGRTGPCTQLIIEAGVRRVVIPMQDPDPRVSGRGIEELRSHGIVVDEGLCRAEAARLNRAFVTVHQRHRPLVALKAATSLDARVARAAGERTAISSRESQQKSHVLRATVDAIAVGSDTMRVDDPLLTARGCFRVRPLVRVIFDRRLRTSPTARIFSTLAEGPVVIVTRRRATAPAQAAALEAAGATIIEAEHVIEAVRALARWDVSSLLVEGGPTLQAAFVEAGCVDGLYLIVAPHVLGGRGVRWLDASTFDLSSVSRMAVEPRGPDIWIEADVHGHC